MIFKKQVALVVDAYSTGAWIAPALLAHGVQCVHVRSGPILPSLAASFRREDFQLDLSYESDAQMLQALRDRSVRWVLAGDEQGVLLAARLAQLFDVSDRNDPRCAPAWRDKHRMHEALRAAGVRAMRHFLGDDLQALQRWRAAQGLGYPIVLKPVDSAGSDNVHICADEAEVARAFSRILGAENGFLQRNRAVLAQEYLRNEELEPPPDGARGGAFDDVEYCVNTVSCRGTHRVSEVIKVYRRRIGAAPVHDHNRLLCPVADAPTYRRLGQYVGRVLDALGIHNGPGHSELMVVAGEPVLLETAARLPGGVDLWAYSRALGGNQLTLWVEALLDPRKFIADAALPRQPLRVHSSCVFLVGDRHAAITRPPNITGWRGLASFHSCKLQETGELVPTCDLMNSPGWVFLQSPRREQIQADIARVRSLEPGVYDSMTGAGAWA